MSMRSALFLLGCSSAFASYPATFPFENEIYTPPALLESDPSFSYKPTDNGGYVDTFCNKMTLLDGTITEDDLPYTCQHTTGFQFALVTFFGAPPVLEDSVWNCTLKKLVFQPGNYLGEVAGQSICTPGACCEHLMGKPKFSDDQLTWQDWFNGRVEANVCGEITEALYCVMIGGHYQIDCMEFFGSVTDRPYTVHHCYDSWVLYWMTCKTFVAKGASYTQTLPWEPETYTDRCSTEEFITMDSLMLAQDRVCHPYSYYNPETSSTATDSSSSSPPAFVLSWFFFLFYAFY